MSKRTNTLVKNIKRSRSGKLAFLIICFFAFLAVFGDFIANEKPFYCKFNGKTYFPIFNSYAHAMGWAKIKHPDHTKDWQEINFERSIWPLIPYSANTNDLKNTFKGPFEKKVKSGKFGRHLLGSGQLGKDVLAGIISGTRVAFLVGLLSMVLATLIGLILGSIAGFFGDRSLRIGPAGIIFSLIWLIYFPYFLFFMNSDEVLSLGKIVFTIVASIGLGTFFWYLGNLLDKTIGTANKFHFPIDLIIMRFLDIMESIPDLLLLFAMLTVISQPGISSLIIIIGLAKWTNIAKFVRAEMLKIRSKAFIQSSNVIGNTSWESLLKHALPNAIQPVVIVFAFGVASAILIETGLSFLSLGVPEDTITWGKLLSNARQKPSAWWLAIFPGMAIFLCVFAFNKLGDVLKGE